jgi:cbb3-type cytochrome oxidase maturation protein
MSVTVLLAVFFLFLFFRNVKSGQYDDVYTPSVRMLFDDELVKKKKEVKEENKPKVTISSDTANNN